MLPKNPDLLEENKYHIGNDVVFVDDRVRVLNHFDTFGIFDRWGDMHPHAKKLHGIYHQGTRFINKMELRINGQKPLLLSSAIKENNQVLSVDLTNPAFDDCGLAENTVHISRSQFIRNGVFFEELRFNNYGPAPCAVSVTLSFGSDFKDIFELRGVERKVEHPRHELIDENDKIIFDYKGLDEIHRRSEITFSADGYEIKRNMCIFHLELLPQKTHLVQYSIFFNACDSELATVQYTEVKTGHGRRTADIASPVCRHRNLQ